MRLYVGIFYAEKLFCSFNRQCFYFIYHFATSVISSTRVTFCVFIG